MIGALIFAGLGLVAWIYSFYNLRDAVAINQRTEKLCTDHDKKVREIRAQLADLKSKGLEVDAKCPKCKQSLRILAPFPTDYFPHNYAE